MWMSPTVVCNTHVRASADDASLAASVGATTSRAAGFSLNTSLPPPASSPSSGSLLVNRYRRLFWNALHTSVGSFSVAALMSFPLPRERLSFCGTPWNIASRANRSVFSTLPTIRAHRLVTKLTTLIPSSVAYRMKFPLSSKMAFGYPVAESCSDLPISRSTATRRPKSISSSAYVGLPDLCASFALSSDSSMTYRSFPEPKRNTRTFLSGPVVVNCSPSGETSSVSALVFAFASAYRSVSSLNRNETASCGNSYVDGDQYSMTPLSSAEITTRFAALYFMTRTAALCVSSTFTGSVDPDAAS
mmetsp:Transcript_4366/g.18600  ORF Transcript_4366/g.18600 Transcript_4366/m.18600 type:complete len:303 (+) Transcript_4366:589-1497(+)